MELTTQPSMKNQRYSRVRVKTALGLCAKAARRTLLLKVYSHSQRLWTYLESHLKPRLQMQAKRLLHWLQPKNVVTFCAIIIIANS